MDGLRAWALTVCATALVCGLCYRLFPDNLLGKQGRLLLPCLFVLVLLLPLKTMDISFEQLSDSSLSPVSSAVLESRIKQQTVAYVNETLLSMANQALVSYGVEAKKVTADMNFTADGGIEMGQIVVYIDKNAFNKASVVRQVVEQRLGTAVVLAQWEDANR